MEDSREKARRGEGRSPSKYSLTVKRLYDCGDVKIEKIAKQYWNTIVNPFLKGIA